MIQLNSPSQVFLHRTLKPKYARHQATAKAGFLDLNWNRSVPIWPGMVAMRTTGVAYAENAQSFASASAAVASGANGTNVSTFTGTQTLALTGSLANFAPAGSVTVATSTGTALLSYTSITGGTTLAGVSTVNGTGTLATGGSVTQPIDQFSPVTQQQVQFPSGAESAYTLLNGVGLPAGLFAQYIGGDGIDELEMPGVDAVSVWVLGPDAEFEVFAPAFDAVNFSWQTLLPANGTDLLLYGRTANLTGSAFSGLNGQGGSLGTYGLQGQLVPSSDANASVHPVARVLSVNSPTSLTIGGLVIR